MDEPIFYSLGFQATVIRTLESHATELRRISHEIWGNPELSYREFQAVKLLTNYLESCNHRVERNYKNLETSFLSEFTTTGYQKGVHSTVAVLCEYDALPEIGHACGHNLIAMSGLATFLAVCDALKESGVEGRMLCMGAPAEELGGGKVILVESGAFDDVDFALMAHPAPIDLLEPDILGVETHKAEFFGKAAHASCGPWEGINALDALVSAYNNISMMRQQLKPGHQIHLTVANGGAKPNIIPDYTKLEINIRAPTAADLTSLRKRVMACLKAGAEATGCRLEVGLEDISYSGLLTNRAMLSVYKHYGLEYGMVFPSFPPSYGSTDMGNVSTTVPSIHPAFSVGDPVLSMLHTREFQVSVGKPQGPEMAARAAMVLSMTSLELFLNAELREKVTTEFRERRASFVGSDDGEEDPSSTPENTHFTGKTYPKRAFLVKTGLLPASSLLPEKATAKD